MSVTFARTVILYLLVVVGLRIMGKRQIGEMQPSELVVAIMISDLSAVPMQEIGIPLLSGVIPIFTLIIMEIALSAISLKNRKIRHFITGKPSVVIHNGRIMKDEMRRLRFNRDDLFEQLRLQGYIGVGEIHFAILETNGQLSIIPFKNNKACTPEDVRKIIAEELNNS